MIKTRSDSLLVWVTNTQAAGGSAVIVTNTPLLVTIGSGFQLIGTINTIAIGAGNNVTVTNSGGLFAMQSGAWSISSTILNSAGWVVNVANTGGGSIILNSGGLFAQQSGPWTVTIANTGGTALSQTIANTAGWIVAVSNTANTSVIVANTGGTVLSQTIANTAGWVVAVSNTAGTTTTVLNSSNFVTTYDSSRMYDGTTQLTMQYASINIVNSTNTVLVNAQTNLRIKIMSMMMIAQGTGLVTIQSGSSSGIGLTGPIYLAANVGFVLPFNQNGWMQTQTSTQLNLNLTSPTSIGGCISYLATS